VSFYKYWSKGFTQSGDPGVMVRFDAAMSVARAGDLERFRQDLRGGVGLMDALANLVGPASATDPTLDQIDASWFGRGDPGPMWLADSKLTPSQIHEVMRETGVQIAEHRLSDPDITMVEMFCHCGYQMFETWITRPVNRPDVLRVWIFGPDNMAEAKKPLKSEDDSRTALEQLIGQVGSNGPTLDQIRRAHEIAEHWDAKGKQVYAGTVFARSDGNPFPGALSVDLEGELGNEPVAIPDEGLPVDSDGGNYPGEFARIHRIRFREESGPQPESSGKGS
jgi:hypothetical protein